MSIYDKWENKSTDDKVGTILVPLILVILLFGFISTLVKGS